MWRTDATNECILMIIAENPDGMSTRDIAPHMGLSFQRVQQIEQEAIAKLLKLLDKQEKTEARVLKRKAA